MKKEKSSKHSSFRWRKDRPQLCKILEDDKNNYNVQLVEKNAKRCEELSELLYKTLILKGDGTNLKFIQEEELDQVDVLVAVTGDDKSNLLTSVLAKKIGCDKDNYRNHQT